MNFFTFFSHTDSVSRFILLRCIQLSALLLAASLVLVVWAGPYGLGSYWLHQYAASMRDAAMVILAAGGVGSALLEDILVHR